MLRFLFNLALAGFWLYVFNALEWLTFINHETLSFLEMVFIVAFVTKIVEYIVDWIFFLFVLFTCGIGVFLLPVIMLAQGWIWLKVAADLTSWFSINYPRGRR